MAKNFDFYKNKSFRWSFVSMTLILLVVVFWSLDKGIVMLDEAFYMLHFQEGAYPIATSNWLQLAKPFYDGNLIHLRLLIFLSILLSSFSMGFVMSSFFKFDWPPFFTGMLTVFFQFVLAMPVQYVPNNATINLILINLSLLFFFSAFLAKDRRVFQFGFLFLSGLCLGFVPFAMITNLPLLGLFGITIILIYQKNRFLTPFLFWILGLASSVSIYFLFLQDWNEFLIKFKEAVEFGSFMSSHGIKPLLKWHYQLFVQFAGIPLALAILNVIMANNPLKEYFSQQIIKILTGVLVLFLVVSEVFSPFGVFSTTLFYSLLFSLLWIGKAHFLPWKQEYWVLVLLLLIPYAAALGTDVPFQIRSVTYFPITFLLLIILIKKIEIRYFNLYFFSLAIVLFLNFLTYPMRDGWARHKLVEQTIEYELPHGQGKMKLDKDIIDALEFLKPHVSPNDKVIISSANQWGLVYLLGAQMPVLAFWRNEAYTLHFLKDKNINKTDLILLEGKYNPFSEKFKNEFFEGKEMKTIKTGDFTLYRF